MQEPETTNWNVIQGAAAGRQSELDEFATRYGDWVRTLLQRRWRNTPHFDLIDDAVQEVFVECLKSGGVLQTADREAPGGFRPFLQGVVRNVAMRVETRRVRQRRVTRAIEPDQFPLSQTSLSRALDREWARGVVREAAEDQERRAVELGAAALLRVKLLRLRFHDGLPIRDIADRWDMDADYLHHQYAKARRDFRRALARVLARRLPGAEPERIERECRRLMDLLQ